MSGRRERRRRRKVVPDAGPKPGPKQVARPQAGRASTLPPTARLRPAADYDVSALVKGASAGFTILILGELLAPLAGALGGLVAGLWLSLVGAAGFAVAGRRVGRARKTLMQGAAAALGALTLTLPLRLLAGAQQSAYAFAVTAVFAVVIGGLSGRAAGALRARAS